MNSYPLIDGQSRFDAVIVANGSYPQNMACHTLIQHALHLIVCDGAAQSLVNDGVEAHRMTVIGDGDSLPDSLKSRLHFIHVTEQDDNDLTKATRYLMSLSTFKGCKGSLFGMYRQARRPYAGQYFAHDALLFIFSFATHHDYRPWIFYSYLWRKLFQNLCPPADKYL